MTSNKSLESNVLQNAVPFGHSQNLPPTRPLLGSAPRLPQRPDAVYRPSSLSYLGYGSGYGGNYSSYGSLGNYGGLRSYGGLSSYGPYGSPYNSSLYNSYGGYNAMGMYGMPGSYGGFNDDAERRFIQFAEESSRNTFSNVESIVRAFSSIAMMLDNTFFAMTSSFRAVLSVADNFGRLRSTTRNSSTAAWNQAVGGTTGGLPPIVNSGSNWPTVAFLGVLVSAPYIISKFLPKYEDKSDVSNWKSPGIPARVTFDFMAASPSEMNIQANEDIILAPTYIQESMNLKNSGWAFAVSNGKSGIVPLNYLILNKPNMQSARENFFKNNSSPTGNFPAPVLKNTENNGKTETKTHQKRVSFGENQIFENTDLDDVIKKAEDEARQYKNNSKPSFEKKTEVVNQNFCEYESKQMDENVT